MKLKLSLGKQSPSKPPEALPLHEIVLTVPASDEEAARKYQEDMQVLLNKLDQDCRDWLANRLSTGDPDKINKNVRFLKQFF